MGSFFSGSGESFKSLHLKSILYTILLLIALKGNAQIGVIADPATSPMEFTDLSGALQNPNTLQINVPVLLKVPVYNFNNFNTVPSGSIIIKIGLGSKFNIDPSFNLATAPLSNYFIWSSSFNSGQIEIVGNCIAP